MNWHWVRRILALSTLGFGCEHQLRNDAVATEHLIVQQSGGLPLCGGTAPMLEREYQRIGSLLGLATLGTVEVMLGSDAVAGECVDHADNVTGCALDDGAGVRVATELPSATHELVHAARLSTGVFANRFFEEGLAEATRGGEFGGYQIADFSSLDPLSPVELVSGFDTSVGGYVTAGHFVSWMNARYGSGAFPAFSSSGYASAATGEQIATWFEEEFGESLVVAESSWRSTADYAYWQPGPCSPDVVRIVDMGSLVVEGEIDCARGSTIGPSTGSHGEILFAAQPQCLKVPHPATVFIEVEASSEVRVDIVPRGCDESLDGSDSMRIVGTSTAMLPVECWLHADVRTSSHQPQPFRIRATII